MKKLIKLLDDREAAGFDREDTAIFMMGNIVACLSKLLNRDDMNDLLENAKTFPNLKSRIN